MICRTIYFLAKGQEDVALDLSIFTPLLGEIIFALLCITDRTDVGNSKLQFFANEALNEIVRCSQMPQMTNMLDQFLNAITNMLVRNIDLPILSSEEKKKQSDLQALLCGVFQIVIQNLCIYDDTKLLFHQAFDQLMTLFLRFFTSLSSTVHEEAMFAIRAFADATVQEFFKYMPQFYNYLK